MFISLIVTLIFTTIEDERSRKRTNRALDTPCATLIWKEAQPLLPQTDEINFYGDKIVSKVESWPLYRDNLVIEGQSEAIDNWLARGLCVTEQHFNANELGRSHPIRFICVN